MKAVLLLLAVGTVLAGCSSAEISSQDQASKAAALDKISKSGPGGDKVQQ